MALIEAFPKEVVMSPSMDRIADFLEDVFLAQKGLVGWGEEYPNFRCQIFPLTSPQHLAQLTKQTTRQRPSMS